MNSSTVHEINVHLDANLPASPFMVDILNREVIDLKAKVALQNEILGKVILDAAKKLSNNLKISHVNKIIRNVKVINSLTSSLNSVENA